jgi:hypothetical protein
MSDVTLQIYASENVSSSVVDTVDEAITTDLDSQLEMTIDSNIRTSNYSDTRIYNRDMTLDEFEPYVGENDGFTNKDYFMVITDLATGGLTRYGIGKNIGQEYSPYTYAIGTIGTDVPANEYKSLAIHEFCHAVMDQYYGQSCPEPDTTQHSCGEVQIDTKNASPMLTYYIPEASNNNWAICSGDPEDYNGYYTTSFSTCTVGKINEYTTYNI